MARSPTTRNRNYCSILYPEDEPNWESKLRNLHITACVSPLHTGEKEDGSELKPHYHVVLMYDSVKTIEQAKEDFVSFGALDRCESIRAIRSYLRYLCHLDENPKEKEHYDPYLVHVFGDFDYIAAINSTEDDLNILGDITCYVHDYHITSFIDFQYFNWSHNMDWFRIIARNATMYVKEIIKSEYLKQLSAQHSIAELERKNTENRATATSPE